MNTPTPNNRLPEEVLSRMFSAYDNHPLVSQEDAMQAAWDASPGPGLLEALFSIASECEDEPSRSSISAIARTAIKQATGGRDV